MSKTRQKKDFFELVKNKTSFRQEALAGLTNFMAMSYMILVVPSMLADAGMPHSQAVSAVIWSAVIGTLIMSFYGKFPVAVAPGLGACAFFSYYVCGAAGYSWQTALGAVFISGIVFLILALTHIRQMIIDAVPNDLKYAIVAGTGAFIAFIGMKSCGLIVADASTFVKLGNVTNAETLLALLGLFVTATLISLNIRSAMLIAIIAITIIGIICGVTSLPKGAFFSLQALFPSELFLQMDIMGALSHGLFSIIISLTMVDMFDSMGVLIAIAQKANFVKEDGKIKNLDRAMISDSIGTISGAMLGTPTVTAYLECATGATAGGRTGLTALVTAFLFILTLAFVPLATMIPAYATAPILIIVGALMLSEVAKINFSNFAVTLSTFLTIITMPLSFNIATGIGFGFISWTLMQLFTGKIKEINPVMAIVSIFFAINFALR